MCFASRPAYTPPPVAPAPVPQASPMGDDIAPELQTISDTEEAKKKKVKKAGTTSLQTSGLSIGSGTGTSSGLNIT